MIHSSLTEKAFSVLKSSDPIKKCFLTFEIFEKYYNKKIEHIGSPFDIIKPERPEKPLLLPPKFMPRRRALTKASSRSALIHSLAHIELNAIDLAWDIIARYSDQKLPPKFYNDWISVARDEASHFLILSKRLKELDIKYGDLNAHDGLWNAAMITKNSLIKRLAIIPMYFEARGLDISPEMIVKLIKVDDLRSAKCLKRIYIDEIRHVKIGEYWFKWACKREKIDPNDTWKNLLYDFFKKKVTTPKNNIARTKANMSAYLT